MLDQDVFARNLNICVLFYADDSMLLAENLNELQGMLDSMIHDDYGSKNQVFKEQVDGFEMDNAMNKQIINWEKL